MWISMWHHGWNMSKHHAVLEESTMREKSGMLGAGEPLRSTDRETGFAVIE
jgi:hypothetical protein